MFQRQLQVLVTLLIFVATASISYAGVGTVTEQTGPTEIKRDSSVIPSSVSTAVEMDDTITTANSLAGITFEDNTQVHITEQSKLVIDNFVYDPNKSTGKLAIKIALGTVKYTSGQIAKHDPQQVKVETPTATIGVRGTDFSSTVDEIGRSTVILLPSCPKGWKDIEKDCVTGKIVIMTDAGELWLTKPFESTTIDARSNMPTKPVILDLDAQQINNLIIVTPPKGVKQATETISKTKNFLDEDFLAVDYLNYAELNKDYLTYNRLNVNYLDNGFLDNLLDMQSSQLLGNELEEFNGLLPKYDKASGLKYFVETDVLTMYKESTNHYAEVNIPTTSAATYIIEQDNITVKQIVNYSGTTSITIKQSM